MMATHDHSAIAIESMCRQRDVNDGADHSLALFGVARDAGTRWPGRAAARHGVRSDWATVTIILILVPSDMKDGD